MHSPRETATSEAQAVERLDSLLGVDMVDQDALERDVISKVCIRFVPSRRRGCIHGIRHFCQRPSF